jgi:hypothetical protein
LNAYRASLATTPSARLEETLNDFRRSTKAMKMCATIGNYH